MIMIVNFPSSRSLLCFAVAFLLLSSTTTTTYAIDTPNVIDEIIQWNIDISQTDRETKFCKMSANEFAFFRGTNHLFWLRYANDERLKVFGNESDDESGVSKTSTWLSGDLHPYNFGSFENDLGDVIYSLNDYDESIVADYQYDLWHMATSIILWMDTLELEDLAELDDDDDDDDDDDVSSTKLENLQEEMIDAFVESYLDGMDYFRGRQDEKEIKFTAESNTYGKLDNFLRHVQDDKSRKKMLNKWCTTTINGDDDENGATRRRTFDFVNNPTKLQPIDSAMEKQIRNAWAEYVATTSLSEEGVGVGEYFHIKSIAKRINAGTGSLGRERYYILVEGPSLEANDDDVILDMKLQTLPTPLAYLGSATNKEYNNHFGINHALRHAVAYSALIDEADNHLGWIQISDSGTDNTKFFSIRERSPYKETLDNDDASLLELFQDSEDFLELAEQWGSILATAHARADKDTHSALYVQKSVDKQIDLQTEGRHEEFRHLVKEIAYEYSQQVRIDYEIFRDSSNLLLPSNNCS